MTDILNAARADELLGPERVSPPSREARMADSSAPIAPNRYDAPTNPRRLNMAAHKLAR
jgi:hypothetical protein